MGELLLVYVVMLLLVGTHRRVASIGRLLATSALLLM